MTEYTVEHIPDSGTCGGIGDLGGEFPQQSEQFRDRTNCHADAEFQVFRDARPPEHATIVSVCEDHIDDAKEFLADQPK